MPFNIKKFPKKILRFAQNDTFISDPLVYKILRFAQNDNTS